MNAKLCLHCGQSLQGDVCQSCKILWGCKQLIPELEAFTSYAHNAKLSPEKLAELESLLANFRETRISIRSMQEAGRRDLGFKEPANEKRKKLKALADFNRRLLLKPDQEFKDGFRRRVSRQLRQLAIDARDLGNCEYTKRRAEEIFWHRKDESSEIILWFNEAISNGEAITEELLKEAIKLCWDALGKSHSEPKEIDASKLIEICDRLDALADGQYAGDLLPIDPDLIIEKTRSELRTFFNHWDHYPTDKELLTFNGIEVENCLALPHFDQEHSRLLKSLRRTIKLTEEIKAESPLLRELNELLLHYQVAEGKLKLYPALAELSRLKSIAGRYVAGPVQVTTPHVDLIQQIKEMLEAPVNDLKSNKKKAGKPNGTEKKFLCLLEDYHNWQQSQFELTSKKRFNAADWLEAQDQWPKRSKNFFTERDQDRESESDFDGSVLLSQLLGNARKIRLKYYGDDETSEPILFNPPFRRSKEVLSK